MRPTLFSTIAALSLITPIFGARVVGNDKDVARRHALYVERRQAAVGGAPPSVTVPALASITSGMPVEPTVPLPTIYAAGSTPPVKGAPPLPSINVQLANYPTPDMIPPTNSPEVQEWLKEIAGANIPNLAVTKEGSCELNPDLAKDTSRCWWTCGGCTRPTDITTCPDKLTWGVSYDDGPSDYTPKLINFLDAKQLHATFFVVGSRVLYKPQHLQTEYMKGHQISVHTWSHSALTNLTNEQIVAELGWTRKIIKDVTGVSPNTMRPPFGDIDDRVRAISMAMGMTPIIWTGSGETEFDTDDWKVPAGMTTGQGSVTAFQSIMKQAAALNTGFIVLEHDLFQQTVDLSVGYFLPAALSNQPAFNLQPIYQCIKKNLEDSYVETASNSSSPATPSGSSAPSGSAPSTPASSSKPPTGASPSSAPSSSNGTTTGSKNGALKAGTSPSVLLGVTLGALLSAFAFSL